MFMVDKKKPVPVQNMDVIILQRWAHGEYK